MFTVTKNVNGFGEGIGSKFRKNKTKTKSFKISFSIRSIMEYFKNEVLSILLGSYFRDYHKLQITKERFKSLQFETFRYKLYV